MEASHLSATNQATQNTNESAQNINQRINYLDLLRGFAVLGLLFMNLPHMGIFELGYVMHQPLLFIDKVMITINAFFFDGRFRSLFCILFAIGLYLQFQRYQPKPYSPLVILKSRMFWLLLFGFVHCVFIWPGDILLMYAMCGLLLLRRLEWHENKLLRFGTWFFVIGMIIFVIQWLLVWQFDEPIIRGSETYVTMINQANGSYLDTIVSNLIIAVAYVVTFPFITMFYLVGTMLIGLGLYKRGELINGFSKIQLTYLAAVTIAVSGLDAYMGVLYPVIWSGAQGMMSSLSGLSLALLIWHFVVTSRLADKNNVLISSIKNVGRMAFTMYILQSAVMTLIFREFYFDWTLSFNLFDYFVVSAVFMVIQMTLASLYLKFFKQGPLEFIWRKAVERRLKLLEDDVMRLNKERQAPQA